VSHDFKLSVTQSVFLMITRELRELVTVTLFKLFLIGALFSLTLAFKSSGYVGVLA
jgi:hypothetical protein